MGVMTTVNNNGHPLGKDSLEVVVLSFTIQLNTLSHCDKKGVYNSSSCISAYLKTMKLIVHKRLGRNKLESKGKRVGGQALTLPSCCVYSHSPHDG